MNQETPSPHSDSQIQRQLTAYLDGELTQEEIRDVENRLATDEEYRALMQELQQTWDILDVLPSSQAKASFTQSTMKMVVDDAKFFAERNTRRPWTWPLRILALLLVPAIASSSAFLSKRYFQNQPNQRLLRDLAVVRNLEYYNCDPHLDIEFLELLAREGDIFGNVRQQPISRRTFKDSDAITDVDSVIQLNATQKNRLRINNDAFQEFPVERQSRLMNFQMELEQHDSREQLQWVLVQYASWLKTLKSLAESDYASLMDSSNTIDRIEKIRLITEEQFFVNFGKSGPTEIPQDEAKRIYLGFLAFLQNREDAIRDMYIQLYGQIEFMDLWIDARRRLYREDQAKIYVGGQALKHIKRDYRERIDHLLLQSDVRRIEILLSDYAKERIEWAVAVQETEELSKAQLLTNWMLHVFNARFGTRPLPQSLEELYERLPTKMQDQLDNEHPEDRLRMLQKMQNERNVDLPN